MLEKVVELSSERLHARLVSKHGKRKNWPPKDKLLLHKRVEELMNWLLGTNPNNPFQPLCQQLNVLWESLLAVEQGSHTEQLGLLKVVVLRSFEVSTMESHNSLYERLRNTCSDLNQARSSTALEIDKIGKYLELCHDTMRLARQPKYRPLFSNIRVEYCQKPPMSKPEGSRIRCRVHGEVQLIMFYEEHPHQPPPRAIGSSKSACFLCDLLISKHGQFKISHSHKRLYEPWTIPPVEWMNPEQTSRFNRIVQEMNVELVHLIGRKRQKILGGSGPESRVHLLSLPEGRSLSPPTSNASIANLRSDSPNLSLIEVSTEIAPSNIELSKSSLLSTKRIFEYEDLPITEVITKSKKSCTVHVGNVDYLFDLEDVQSGELKISKPAITEQGHEIPTNLRLDVRELPQTSSKSIRADPKSQELTFHVHDAELHELCVTFTWTDSNG